MHRNLKPALAAMLLLVPASPAPGDAGPPVVLAFSEDFTARLVQDLENGIAECQSVAAVYRVDCYRQNYRRAGNALNGKPDYREAQKALRGLEKSLRSTLRSNPDKTAPPLKSGRRIYKPIAPGAVAAAAATFDRARAEAVTILLRADGRAKVHYQRIASVVGSNKLILRTDLLRLLRRA